MEQTRKSGSASATRSRRPATKQVVKPGFLEKATKPRKLAVRTGVAYGIEGTGKTHLFATLSEIPGCRTLCVTLDRYDETLEKFPELSVIDFLKEASGSLHENMKSLVSEFRIKPLPYDAIFFDSISKLMHLERQEVVSEAYKKGQDRVKKNQIQAWQAHDEEVPEQRDYLRVTHRLSSYFWDLRNICISKGIHFFVVAWEKDDWIEDEEHPDGMTMYHPDLSPELLRLMSHEFGFSIRMTAVTKSEKKQVEGKLVSNRVRGFRAYAEAKDARTKNRIGLPAKMDDPTMAKILGERVCDSFLVAKSA